MRRSTLLISIAGMLFCRTLLAGTLEFASATYDVAENASTFTVTVTRSGNVSAAATVTVKSTDLTALVGEDYLNISVALNWAPSELNDKTVSITISDDLLIEGAESFQLDLINLTGDTTGAVDSTIVTISDHEEGSLQFAATEYTVTESAVTVDVTIDRVDGSDGDVEVLLSSADESAIAGSDYEALQITVLFADGESSKEISLTLVDDEIAEIEQAFSLTLSEVTGGGVLGSNAKTVITIEDDDTDFTSALAKITGTNENIIQPDLIDLSKPSPLYPDVTLLEALNGIHLLSSTGLIAIQNGSGILSIDLDSDRIYLRPIRVLRTAADTEAAIRVNDDYSGSLITDYGIEIEFQPALQGLSVLQTGMAEADLPEIIVTPAGNISIQIDQDAPPLEKDADNIVSISNVYYDRYHFRPSPIANLSNASAEESVVASHPIVAEETILNVFFRDGEMRKQSLNPAPLDGDELIIQLIALAGVSDASVLGDGLIGVTTTTSDIVLFSDYIVRKTINFYPLKIGVTNVGDVNGDGRVDIKMVYSNGDEQYFLLLEDTPR